MEDQRYPYLSSVSSLWDSSSPFYVDTVQFSYDFLSKIFRFTITKDTSFKITETSPYGKVLKLTIGDHSIDGKKFMNLLHLKSQFSSNISNSFYLETYSYINEKEQETTQLLDKMMEDIERIDYKSPSQWYYTLNYTKLLKSIEKSKIISKK